MEIKEAIGYLQAVADNAQSTPKYQRALEMAIQSMEQVKGFVCENRDPRYKVYHAILESALASDLAAKTAACEEYKAKIAELEAELRDERDRFDKLTSFELAEAQELENYKTFYNSINALPRCETCTQGELGCVTRPRVGESTRFNCPNYYKEK